MTKQWDAIDLQWDGIEDVQVGDTIKDEDGSIGIVKLKHNGHIWTEPVNIPIKKPDFNYGAHLILAFICWICSMFCWYLDNLQLATMIMTLAIYFLVMSLHCKEDK